jgi:hypothetical protein
MFTKNRYIIYFCLLKFQEIKYCLPCLWYKKCPVMGILGSLFINYFCIVERNFCFSDRTYFVIETFSFKNR